MTKWSQETAGTTWHKVEDSHRNAQYTACGKMLVNAQGHSDGKPASTNVCKKCEDS